MNTTAVQLAAPFVPPKFYLSALEAMPADLRQTLGWPQLLLLVLDSVMKEAAGGPSSPRQIRHLTVMTYCYAANLLASEDIENATVEEADVAYIVEDETITAAELRSFRRHHRDQLERCLGHVLRGALGAAAGREPNEESDSEAQLASVQEFARRRLNLAVVFDTAMNE